MNSPAIDIAKYLASVDYTGLGGFGGSDRWCVNAVWEPAEPNDVVTVYDSGGTGPDTDELDISVVNFQVRVRCAAYNEGYAIHEIIRDLLILPAPIVMETSTFVGVTMTSDVIGIGRDDNDRHLLTANYQAIREI